MMELDLNVEQEDDRLVISSPERNHTVMNLMKQAVWNEDGKAGYDKGHPYTGESKLVITADDPEQVLADAIDRVKGQLDDLEDAF